MKFRAYTEVFMGQVTIYMNPNPIIQSHQDEDLCFTVDARHELKHARHFQRNIDNGDDHSKNPDSLMYPSPKCDSDRY